jgi:hypothetical protein
MPSLIWISQLKQYKIADLPIYRSHAVMSYSNNNLGGKKSASLSAGYKLGCRTLVCHLCVCCTSMWRSQACTRQRRRSGESNDSWQPDTTSSTPLDLLYIHVFCLATKLTASEYNVRKLAHHFSLSVTQIFKFNILSSWSTSLNCICLALRGFIFNTTRASDCFWMKN